MSYNILMLGGKIESSMEGNQTGTNTFSLKRIGVEPSFHSVEVDFSPSPTTPFSQSPNPIPAFNPDHHFFTPSFILKSNHTYSPAILKSYLELHNCKLAELTE
jgi:hypothetical protein